jgi:diaminohydroxyphosphoribosylaminopyrimidine deaminase / 5-amino-6-(5-phosphoribosylamino)uracil reductase
MMDKNGVHEFWMNRCLQLAMNGLGSVSPNPMVGCVIVHGDEVIGEGFHRKYGKAHAEVNAIGAVRDHEKLKASTLYVNLEPCSHYGKTPPCAELIIKSNIPKVVIACKDPYEEVSGKGIQLLMDAGIEVVSGVLESEAKELNRRFFTFQIKKSPYIILKWAQTLDGFIDSVRPTDREAAPVWITNEELRVIVHKWRTEEDAIMVGTNTALMDNPRLTARDWEGRNPLRIVIDRDLSLPDNLHLFDQSTPTIVLTGKKKQKQENLEYLQLDFKHDIIDVLLKELFNRNIQSLIIEGGKQLLESFINSGLWDEARILTGAKRFGRGVKAPEFPFIPEVESVFREDRISIYRNI